MSRKPKSFSSNHVLVHVLSSDSETDHPPHQSAVRSGSNSPETPHSTASTPYSVGLPGFDDDDDAATFDERLTHFALPDTHPVPPKSSNTPETLKLATIQHFLDPIEICSDMHLPAWLNQSHVDNPLTLHEEIIQFCLYAEPFVEEQNLRHELLGRIRSLVQSLWREARVLSFGSYETGLYLPLSDMDVVVFNAPGYGSTAMHKLAAKLRGLPFVSNLNVISRARVPIIKFTDTITKTEVDISFNQESGLDSSTFVKQSMLEWPELKPLVIIIKYFLKLKDFNEPYTGGIGSYALVIMVLSHLQMTRPASRPDFGSLLCGFLELYGRKFNYITTGVSVQRHGSYFSKTRRGWACPETPARLSIEDPQNPENDVGKNAYKILEIQQAFSVGYDALKSTRCFGTKSDKTFLQRFFGESHAKLEEHRKVVDKLTNSGQVSEPKHEQAIDNHHKSSNHHKHEQYNNHLHEQIQNQHNHHYQQSPKLHSHHNQIQHQHTSRKQHRHSLPLQSIAPIDDVRPSPHSHHSKHRLSHGKISSSSSNVQPPPPPPPPRPSPTSHSFSTKDPFRKKRSSPSTSGAEHKRQRAK